MTSENEKNGIFRRLMGSKKAPKSSCCSNIELEEIPEGNSDTVNEKESQKAEENPCCK